MKNKLFLLCLIIIIALSVLVACTQVIEDATSDEIMSENSSASGAQPDDSNLEHFNSDYPDLELMPSANTEIADANNIDEPSSLVDCDSVYGSDASFHVDENTVAYGGDATLALPENNSIRATRIRSTATKIAVTFDDGPAPYTERILDVLEQYNSRATFFVVGSRIRAYPEIVTRAFESGHEVANHSWSHPSFPRVNDARIRSELQRTCDAIRELLGFSPPFFRPPYGATNDRVVSIAGEMGYAVIKWTLDPKDWRYRNADTIYNSVMSRVEGGSVILLHDIHPTTADATELLIPSLIEMGFELVTVTELLTYLYGELTPGRIYGMQVITD